MRIMRYDVVKGIIRTVARYDDITTSTACSFMVGFADKEAVERAEEGVSVEIIGGELSGRAEVVLRGSQRQEVVRFYQEW